MPSPLLSVLMSLLEYACVQSIASRSRKVGGRIAVRGSGHAVIVVAQGPMPFRLKFSRSCFYFLVESLGQACVMRASDGAEELGQMGECRSAF